MQAILCIARVHEGCETQMQMGIAEEEFNHAT